MSLVSFEKRVPIQFSLSFTIHICCFNDNRCYTEIVITCELTVFKTL